MSTKPGAGQIDSDSKIRFERHIRRARDEDLKTFDAFQEEDEKQRKFGALRVAAEIAETTISNEGSLEQYKRKIDEFLNDLTRASSAVVPADKAAHFSELHRCLFALHRIEAAASCEKIHEETARFGTPVRIYNTNRALKEIPEFAARIEQADVLLQYEITVRGRQLLTLLDITKGLPELRPAPLRLPFGK